MDDYRNLVDKIRESNINGDVQIEQWAVVIETLIAERDAAIKDLRYGGCCICKHERLGIIEYPCCNCVDEDRISDYWEWRGVKKEAT